MDYRLRKLGQYLRGWLGYFGISQYYQPIPELDEWLRRRVRMCYWKQWRLARKLLLAIFLPIEIAASLENQGLTRVQWEHNLLLSAYQDSEFASLGRRFENCDPAWRQ